MATFTPFRQRDIDQVGGLVLQLKELGVDLPPVVVSGADRLMRIHAFRPDPIALARQALTVDDEGMRRLLVDVGVAHALVGSAGPGASAVSTVRSALMEALADELLDGVDEILDQLRPDFDRAGELVHEAAQLGITGRTTDRDIVKADNIEAMRDAWTALPGLTAKLDAIAAVRIAITRACGAPPAPTLGSVHAHADLSDTVIGAMFHPAAPRWREDFEQSWHMWLRLCRAEPVRLMSLSESVAALEGGA